MPEWLFQNMKGSTQLYIFLLFIAIAFLFMSRYYVWSDGELRYRFTLSLVEQDVPVEKISYPPLQSILSVPFYLVGKAGSNLFDTELEITTRNSVKVLIVLAYAVICLYVFKSLVFFGVGRLTSLVSTFIFSLTSMALPYVSSFFSELLTGALLLVSIYYCIMYLTSFKVHHLILVQLFLILLALNNYLFILVFPILYFYLLSKCRDKRILSTSVFLTSFIITSLFILSYNYWRYHNIFNFGYTGNRGYPTIIYSGEPGFSGSALIGLYGFFFSSGKSIFIFSPSLLLFFGCYKKFFREKRKEFMLYIVIFLVFTIIYSKWWAWYGGVCWGPRFLLPFLSLLYIIIGYGLKELFNKAKWPVIFIISTSFLVQFIAISIHPTRDLSNWLQPEFQNEYLLWFVPHFSPVFTHWKYLKDDGIGLLHIVNRDFAGRLLFFINITTVAWLLYLVIRRIGLVRSNPEAVYRCGTNGVRVNHGTI